MPVKRMIMAAAAALPVVLGAAAASAQTGPPLEDVLKGFETEAPAAPPAEKGGQPEKAGAGFLPSWLRLGGSIGQDLSLNFAHDAPPAGATDHRGLSGLRTRLDVETDVTFSEAWRARITGYAFYDWAYRIQGRDQYTGAFLDAYESEADVGDAYVQGRITKNFDLKVGRQVVVWGKSDNIRITDILNPLDVRLPGRTDIEDLRLPVTMSKLDVYAGAWNLSAIAIHEIRFNKMPVFGSDFFTASTPLPPRDKPDTGLGGHEFAASLNGVFRGWDLSFYGAHVYDDLPHVVLTPAGLRRRHSRLWMGGLATNVALGNWLLKGELAFLDGFEFLGAPGETFSRLDLLAGAEYSGFTDTTVSLEIANRHLFGADSRIGTPPDDGHVNDPEAALRLNRTFLNETLDATLVVSIFGLTGQNGAFQRAQATYDLTDAAELTAGIIFYQSGDRLRFRGIGDNDRVFLRVRYRW